MSTPPKKRLLPEVLPTPVRTQSSPRARASVLRHYERLATIAAGAAVVVACNGYGVVDPLPPPAVCAAESGALRVAAAFVEGENGQVLLEIALSSADGRPIVSADAGDGGVAADADAGDAGEPIRVMLSTNMTGTIVSQSSKGNDHAVFVEVPHGASRAELRVTTSCRAGSDTEWVALRWTGDPSVGNPVSASLFADE